MALSESSPVDYPIFVAAAALMQINPIQKFGHV
jgi:hypothetical protein